MRIVQVSGHACIRTTKQAVVLRDKGHDVDMIAKKIPHHHEYFNTLSACEHTDQYIEAIKLYSKVADIFHVHNEPSWFVTAIKEQCDIPVVLDVHDSFLARTTPEEDDELKDGGKYAWRIVTEERNNFQLADGLVFPGKAFGDMIRSEFGLEQPSIVLPSYLPSKYYDYSGREYLGGLVYEGRIDLKGENDKSFMFHGFKYDDYEDFAKQCQELGIDFHVYARNDEGFMKVYKDICIVHNPQSYQNLMPCLARHDWGLVGNVFHSPEWDVAFPNKLFEYIASGVPIVSINAKECSDFIMEEGIGISVESLEELAQRWGEHTECRKTLLKKRQKYTMEHNIGELISLYERLI